MKITLLISDDCRACQRALKALSDLQFNGGKLSYTVTNVANASVNKVPIVPALYVNNKLFCYGDIDTGKLAEYLSNLQIGL
jgi:hypothetical protein